MAGNFFSHTVTLVALSFFGVAFGLIAAHTKVFRSARWFSVAFFCGAIAVSFEIIWPEYHGLRFGLALHHFFVQAASVAGIIGVLRRFKTTPTWKVLGLFLLGTFVATLLIPDFEMNSVEHSLLLSLPTAAAHLYGAYIVFRYGERQVTDLILSGLLFASFVNFISNPIIMGYIGTTPAPGQADLFSTYMSVWISGSTLFGVSIGLMFVLLFVRDMFARARTDGLSGLLNRRAFEDEIDVLLEKRGDKLPVGSFIIADLDDFKQINDLRGHDVGDAVIVCFADILRQCAVDEVVVGRMGGEEFGVFLPRTNQQSARLFAEAVRGAFSAGPVDGFDLKHPPTASFGVAEMQVGESVSDLFRRADVALYSAKESGKDRVGVASPSLFAKAKGSRVRSSRIDADLTKLA